jgi:hypothetical protein
MAAYATRPDYEASIKLMKEKELTNQLRLASPQARRWSWLADRAARSATYSVYSGLPFYEPDFLPGLDQPLPGPSQLP